MTSEGLEMQPVNEADWDYLIVLDACRYDIFEQEYEDFLEGELKKVRSRGSATPEWLKNTFTGRYSYNYISANPYINGEGLTLGDLVSGEDWSWKAPEQFQNVVDSWIKDWDDELNTVRPEDLTDTALENLEYSKTVIHYIQPHRPFISMNEKNFEWAPKNKLEDEEETVLRKALDATRPVWDPVFSSIPYTFQAKIKGALGLGNDYEKLAREKGEEKVKEYYRKDLRLALEEVKRLIEGLDGKVVVTADHGELLGEGGWGHYIGGNEDELLNVPWLEVREKEA
ncbi:hypothetical protein AQV86_00800 [Nanohaloarchaea archaeon SG9]|nr:hypothetical protein AQV86_00800 [Nanohaloarchaea archaeon SG9]